MDTQCERIGQGSMTKEEIVKTIETRLKMIRNANDVLITNGMFAVADALYTNRIDELETLLEYIENPRIK